MKLFFSYKVTSDYNKESEGSILWNDKILNIQWETKDPIVSEKDTNSELFENFNSLF
jgi:dTDP-4-dehydrorhamnose 3,5-epimerase